MSWCEFLQTGFEEGKDCDEDIWERLVWGRGWWVGFVVVSNHDDANQRVFCGDVIQIVRKVCGHCM